MGTERGSASRLVKVEREREGGREGGVLVGATRGLSRGLLSCSCSVCVVAKAVLLRASSCL